jgi:TetR/AcrR family transcriptional repressor of mexJK operon
MASQNEEPPPVARSGRPKDIEKKNAILDAAWEMFLSNGFAATSLEAVAKQAGVSRVTLYSHFPDKTALFEATIQREMVNLAQSQTIPTEPAPLEDALNDFGIGLLNFLTSRVAVDFYRVLAGELRHHPDLAEIFFNRGPQITTGNLVKILELGAARQELEITDYEAAADQLLGLWLGMSHFRLMLNVGVDGLVTTIRERVLSGTEVFLRAYRTSAQ